MSHIERHEGGITFSGAEAVTIYRAIAIKHAILLYARTGLKANRLYTPGNMKRAAEDITGRKFKARDYQGMADAIDLKLKELKTQLEAKKTTPLGGNMA